MWSMGRSGPAATRRSPGPSLVRARLRSAVAIKLMARCWAARSLTRAHTWSSIAAHGSAGAIDHADHLMRRSLQACGEAIGSAYRAALGRGWWCAASLRACSLTRLERTGRRLGGYQPILQAAWDA